MSRFPERVDIQPLQLFKVVTVSDIMVMCYFCADGFGTDG